MQALRERMTLFSEQADPANYKAEPTEDGKHIKIWNDPPSLSQEQYRAQQEQYTQLNEFTSVLLWAQKTLETAVSATNSRSMMLLRRQKTGITQVCLMRTIQTSSSTSSRPVQLSGLHLSQLDTPMARKSSNFLIGARVHSIAPYQQSESRVLGLPGELFCQWILWCSRRTAMLLCSPAGTISGTAKRRF
jgi:hypothetical protein